MYRWPNDVRVGNPEDTLRWLHAWNKGTHNEGKGVEEGLGGNSIISQKSFEQNTREVSQNWSDTFLISFLCLLVCFLKMIHFLMYLFIRS